MLTVDVDADADTDIIGPGSRVGEEGDRSADLLVCIYMYVCGCGYRTMGFLYLDI